MKQKLAILICAVFIIIYQTPEVFAYQIPYQTYNVDYYGQAVPTPDGYKPDKILSGIDIGTGQLKNPEDIFVTDKKEIYILDSGNERIIILDSNFKLKQVIDKFYSDQGEENLNNASGIHVTREGIIYIADMDNNRVIACTHEGKIIRQYKKPESELYPENVEFKPYKVVTDTSKNIYIISKGLYYGAVVYDIDGTFKGFYGSNQVRASAKIVTDYFWKRFLTKEQKDAMARYVPTELGSFDIDNKDFIYTVTPQKEYDNVDIIRRLNPKGNDTFKGIKYSIPKKNRLISDFRECNFTDLVVDEEGFVNLLDALGGKIFHYDPEGRLLFIFGEIGDQKGTFNLPCSIECIDNNILVLDKKKGNLTLFSLTPFGEAIHKAVKLYNEGLYSEAVEPWKEVLKADMNYELAYVGIGKALMYTEDYENAMEFFKLGLNRDDYSEAYEEHRVNVIRKKFSKIMLIILIIVILLIFINKKGRIFKQFMIRKLVKKGGNTNDTI